MKIVTYRPFPKQAIADSLAKAKYIGVVDKNISLGSDGALYSEVKSALAADKNISGFIAGLGGRDITIETVENIIESTKNKTGSCTFVDINKDLLWEEFKAV